MPTTVDYAYYTSTYLGDSIAEADFPRLAARAESILGGFKRIYTVTGTTDDEKLAVCAMADAIFYFETVSTTTTASSSSIGSVSSSASAQNPKDVAKARSAELLRCAETYLDVFRGCGHV